MLTQARLKELLHYDPETGIFTWLVSKGAAKVGSTAGYYEPRGYVRIKIDGDLYQAHRLANLYMEGYLPEYEMDHKKGTKHDNRWGEIRHTTHLCNMHNQKKSKANKSGFTGVVWDKQHERWRAYIANKPVRVHLGYHDDKISAALARCEFEKCCPDWVCNHQAVNFIKLRELGFNI